MMLHEIPAIPEGKTAYTHLVGFLINQDTFKIEMNSLTLLELIHGKGRGNKELHDAICIKLDAYYADKEDKAENVKIEIVENGIKKLHIEKVYILSEDEYKKICNGIDFGVPTQKLLDDGLKGFRLALGDFMERVKPQKEVDERFAEELKSFKTSLTRLEETVNEIEDFIKQDTDAAIGGSDGIRFEIDPGFYAEFGVQNGDVNTTSMLIARMLRYCGSLGKFKTLESAEEVHDGLVMSILEYHASDIRLGAISPLRFQHKGKLVVGFAISPKGVISIAENIKKLTDVEIPFAIKLILSKGFNNCLAQHANILEEHAKRQMLEAIKKMTSAGV